MKLPFICGPTREVMKFGTTAARVFFGRTEISLDVPASLKKGEQAKSAGFWRQEAPWQPEASSGQRAKTRTDPLYDKPFIRLSA